MRDVAVHPSGNYVYATDIGGAPSINTTSPPIGSTMSGLNPATVSVTSPGPSAIDATGNYYYTIGGLQGNTVYQ